MEVIQIRLCGPLEIRDATSGELRSLGDGRPQRSALRALLTAPGRRLSRGALIELLWPERPDAESVAYATIRDIRKAFGGKELCRSFEGCYQLAGQDQIWLDIDAASELMRQAENCPSLALSLLEEALVILSRGQFLEGEEGTWCYAHRRRAEDMQRQIHIWLAEAYEGQGKLWQASEQYRALCLPQPIDEGALRGWMTMLTRAGQPEEAIRRYQEALATGAFISSETRELASHISRPIISLYTPVERSLYPELSSDLYDVLEANLISTTFQWKMFPGTLLDLQVLLHRQIKEYDMTHDSSPAWSRRQALQTLARLPLALYGLRFSSSQEEILPSLTAAIAACWELRKHEPEGLPIIQQTLATYLPTLEAAAQGKYQRDAAFLAAQGYLLLVEIAEEQAELTTMERYCRKARRYGQLAENPSLEAIALSRLAVKYDYQRLYQRSQDTYQEARELPGWDQVSPLLQARITIGIAATSAYLGETNQALTLLERAKSLYPASPELDPSFQFASSSAARPGFTVWEGLVLKHTDRHADATYVFQRFGSLESQLGVLETVRSEHLNYTASTLAVQGDLDGAIHFLEAATDVAVAIQHEQRLAEVGDTLRSMSATWRGEPRVKALREKIRG